MNAYQGLKHALGPISIPWYFLETPNQMLYVFRRGFLRSLSRINPIFYLLRRETINP